MDSETRTVSPPIFKKGLSLEFPVAYSDRYKPDDGWRVQLPKLCDDNRKMNTIVWI